MGGVDGVTVTVEPRTGLRDGELVHVRIDGLSVLPGASVVQCAADVTDDTALEIVRPRLSWKRPMDRLETRVEAMAEQTVAVARTIHITRGSPDPNVPRAYDCATEPAGCVLAVGPLTLPAKAVLVDLEFVDGLVPTVVADVEPASGLQDRQAVEVTASGLRPNATFTVQVCGRSADLGCDGYHMMSVRADATGALSGGLTVYAALYGEHGRADCVPDACEIRIRGTGDAITTLPIQFDEDVVTTFATLTLEPPGPYVDRQEVTVHGRDFPPGIDLTDDIGQCPADKDTAVEERCGYGFPPGAPIIVDEDGEFTITVPVFESLTFAGTCVTGPGCVIAWIIPHGSIAASTERLLFDT